MNLLISNLAHALGNMNPTPDQIQAVKTALEAYYAGKIIPICGKVNCDIMGTHAHVKPHKPFLGGRTTRHLKRLKNS